ncbi:MAG: head GIN domain-containing protein [Mariniphaga sp.]
MKSRITTLFVLLLFTCFQLTIAQTSQKRDVSAFSEISLRISANVHLQQGGNQSVEVKGKEETLKKLITEVNDRKLVIRFPNETFFNKWNPGTIDIYITVPQIDGLSVSGSGSITSEGKIESRILDLAISGSGDIKLGDLKAEKVSSALSGSGNIHLSGSQNAVNLKIAISGSGNVKGIDFPADNVDIKISGSGNCWINSIKKLTVRLAGSGNVVYRGNPSIDSNIAGSGKVKEE